MSLNLPGLFICLCPRKYPVSMHRCSISRGIYIVSLNFRILGTSKCKLSNSPESYLASLSAVCNMLPGNILQKAPKNRVKIIKKQSFQGSQECFESKELLDLIRCDCWNSWEIIKEPKRSQSNSSTFDCLTKSWTRAGLSASSVAVNICSSRWHGSVLICLG